ncbi:MAG: hypothetical protein ACOY9Y_09660 [Bacillota bacterium]
MEGEFGVLVTAFILALFIQLLTGRFKEFITDRKTAFVALLISVLLCVIYKAGILDMLGLKAQLPYGEYADYMLTGVAVSGGASGLTEFARGILGQIVRARDNR